VHEWLVCRAKESIKPEEPLDFEKARTRKVHLEAELAEIELKEKQGELVRADLVQKMGIDFILACKTKLLSLPKKLSPQLSPKDPKRAESLLEKGICEALNELQQYQYFSDFDELSEIELNSARLD
jgi:hypothetical protein